MTQPADLDISSAKSSDVPLILSLINELADYEKLRHESVATEASIHRALFGPKPHAEAVIARFGGTPAGFALFFHNFSTFLGKPGLYLEDLFVRPKFRGKKVGDALLSHVAAAARDETCFGIMLNVLGWNQSAIEFFQKRGATMLGDWRTACFDGDALQVLAARR